VIVPIQDEGTIYYVQLENKCSFLAICLQYFHGLYKGDYSISILRESAHNLAAKLIIYTNSIHHDYLDTEHEKFGENDKQIINWICQELDVCIEFYVGRFLESNTLCLCTKYPQSIYGDTQKRRLQILNIGVHFEAIKSIRPQSDYVMNFDTFYSEEQLQQQRCLYASFEKLKIEQQKRDAIRQQKRDEEEKKRRDEDTKRIMEQQRKAEYERKFLVEQRKIREENERRQVAELQRKALEVERLRLAEQQRKASEVERLHLAEQQKRKEKMRHIEQQNREAEEKRRYMELMEQQKVVDPQLNPFYLLQQLIQEQTELSSKTLKEQEILENEREKEAQRLRDKQLREQYLKVAQARKALDEEEQVLENMKKLKLEEETNNDLMIALVLAFGDREQRDAKEVIDEQDYLLRYKKKTVIFIYKQIICMLN